jgi:TPR repeat protein
MYKHSKISLSDIRTMILCEFPLSTEECGHLYYDGEGVKKSLKEAYVWYRVAQCAGNHKVDTLVNYLDSKLTTSKCLKLSSRARHIYTKALQH